MKKYILIILFSLSLYSMERVDQDQSVKEDIKRFDSIFKEISKKRDGLNQATINALKDPFVYKKEIKKLVKIQNGKMVKKKAQKAVLKLFAIFNNKAKINGKWYRVKQKIDNYKLIRINTNSVILRDGGKRITLFLRKRDDKIKITVH